MKVESEKERERKMARDKVQISTLLSRSFLTKKVLQV